MRFAGEESGWLSDAMQIVDDILSICGRSAWDDLLDLRLALAEGAEVTHIIDRFSRCRARHEENHYLPFFRLRRILSAQAGFEEHLSIRPRGRAPGNVEVSRAPQP